MDGGIFDITKENQGVAPINAALRIDTPAAFVITREKPGGVVVSEQKDVIAIASLAKG